MSITPTPFVAGATFAAADLASRVTTIEDFINGGSAAVDLEDDAAWAESQHIVRPEAFESPHPRVRFVTGPRYHRRRDSDWFKAFVLSDDVASETWIPVHGLCVTLSVQPPPGAAAVDVVVRAGFWAYEKGGNTIDAESARLRLFLDSTTYESTQRSIPGSNSVTSRWLWYSMEKLIPAVSRGIHSVGVSCYILPNAGDPRKWSRIFIRNGTFTVLEHHR